MIHYEHPEISYHQIFFHISKCFACNAEKSLQLKITKKEWIWLTNEYRLNISIFDPVSQIVQMEVSQDLLSYND